MIFGNVTMKNFKLWPIFFLFWTIVFVTAITCQAQDDLALDENWESMPVKPTIYPKKGKPTYINESLPWKIEFENTTPPSAVPLKEQTLVLPVDEGNMHKYNMFQGPPESGIVLVTCSVDAFFSPNKKPNTTMHLVNLKQGKTITKRFPVKMKIYGISPNGRLLAVSPEAEGPWGRMSNLVILRLDDGSFKPVLRFTPFNDSPSTGKNEKIDIRDVFWLDNKQVFLVSAKNAGIKLDLSDQNVGFGIYTDHGHIRSPFFLTPDRKLIFMLNDGIKPDNSGGTVRGLGIFSATDGTQVGYLNLLSKRSDNADDTMIRDNIRFSQNGRLMATSGEKGIYIWSLAKGELIASYNKTGDDWNWVGNRYLLLGDDSLWDAKDQVICSKFSNETFFRVSTVLGDKLLYLASKELGNSKVYHLVCSSVLPPNMEEFLQKAAWRNERVMGPGDSVELEFNLRLSGGDNDRVEQHIRKLCEKNRWKIVAKGDSEYRVVTYMSEPEEEIEVRLSAFGSIGPTQASQKVRPYSVGCAIYQGKKVIWSTSKHFGPYRQYESEAEFNQHLTEGMREKPDWFLERWFPETITRGHTESEQSNATITMNGIVFNNVK